MAAQFEIDPYDPCPCGSGAKYKFCCAAKAKANRHGKYPVGSVGYFGPDDKTVTKITAIAIMKENDRDPAEQHWSGENVQADPKVGEEIKQFFAKLGVKRVVTTEGVLGCPHEEGVDYPDGGECPLCPFWSSIMRRADGGEEEEPEEPGLLLDDHGIPE